MESFGWSHAFGSTADRRVHAECLVDAGVEEFAFGELRVVLAAYFEVDVTELVVQLCLQVRAFCEVQEHGCEGGRRRSASCND